jgi:predicted Fe-Mo cluster-binding NifX family protein
MMGRIGLLFGMVFLLIQPHTLGAGDVLIAVASEGETAEADVSQRAARCSYFLMFDGEGTLKNALENPFKSRRGSAGVSVADYLKERNVTVVVAGMFGNKMQAALEANGIDSLEYSGSVEDAVKRVLKCGF